MARTAGALEGVMRSDPGLAARLVVGIAAGLLLTAPPPALSEPARAVTSSATPADVDAALSAAEKLASSGQPARAAAIYEDLLDPAQPNHVRRGAFNALLRLDSDHGEARVFQALRGSDPVLKPMAITASESLPGEQISGKLAAILPALGGQEQLWLVQVLAARSDPVARKALESALAASDLSVRLEAIEALGACQDAKAAPPLLQALGRNVNPDVQAALEKALIRLPAGEGVDQQLIAMLRDQSVATQNSVIRILAARESTRATPALLESTRRPESVSAAFQALGIVASTSDLPKLMERMIRLDHSPALPEAEAAVAQVLRRLPDPQTRGKVVRQHLTSTLPLDKRCAVLRMLPVCGDADSLAALLAAQKDSDPDVRDASIRALAEWPGISGWDALLATFGRATNAAHRAICLGALVRLAEEPSGSTVERIRRYQQLFMEAQSPDERRACLGSLSELAVPGALTLAFPLLEDPAVRPEAELAVRKLAQAIQKEHPETAADALRHLSPAPGP